MVASSYPFQETRPPISWRGRESEKVSKCLNDQGQQSCRFGLVPTGQIAEKRVGKSRPLDYNRYRYSHLKPWQDFKTDTKYSTLLKRRQCASPCQGCIDAFFIGNRATWKQARRTKTDNLLGDAKTQEGRHNASGARNSGMADLSGAVCRGIRFMVEQEDLLRPQDRAETP